MFDKAGEPRDSVAALNGELQEKLRRILDAEIANRDLRQKLLGAKYSSGPCWGMLLALYKSHLENLPITVTAVISYAQCPAATGIRRLNLLTSGSFAFRIADTTDRRRIHVGLTGRGVSALERYFAGHQLG